MHLRLMAVVSLLACTQGESTSQQVDGEQPVRKQGVNGGGPGGGAGGGGGSGGGGGTAACGGLNGACGPAEPCTKCSVERCSEGAVCHFFHTSDGKTFGEGCGGEPACVEEAELAARGYCGCT